MFPYQIIDLTHALHETSPSWGGGCGFSSETKLDYDPNLSTSFRVQQIKLHCGIGTHMDAPAHCVPGGATIDLLPVEHFLSPCIVLDIRHVVHERYSLSVDDIKKFEAQHGAIPRNSFVIVHTGWEQFWPFPEKYRNNHVFPSISKEVAEFLLSRDVNGIGIDTLSPDRPEDGYPVHDVFLKAGKYIIENVANASKLPPTGSFALPLPMKINCTEAPVRFVAFVPKNTP
jgi:kynurenine formamidase